MAVEVGEEAAGLGGDGGAAGLPASVGEVAHASLQVAGHAVDLPEAVRTTDNLAGLCELAVRPGWQGRGIGSHLHQALADALAPRYLSLLAMPGADSQRLYRRLGYTYVGPYRSAPGGAVFDLLLLEVPPPL